MILQETPRLSEEKVKQCVDSILKGDYPPKVVAKESLLTFFFLPYFQYICFYLGLAFLSNL